MAAAERARVLVRSVSIRGLRGIAEGKLDGLSGITILVGPNNSGKSTILEALYLAASGCEYDLLTRRPLHYVLLRRGWFGLPTVNWLFFEDREGCNIVLNLEREGVHVELELRLAGVEADYMSSLRSRGLDVEALTSIASSVKGLFTRELKHFMDATGQYDIVQETETAAGHPVETLLLD